MLCSVKHWNHGKKSRGFCRILTVAFERLLGDCPARLGNWPRGVKAPAGARNRIKANVKI